LSKIGRLAGLLEKQYAMVRRAIMKRSFEWNGDKAKATREKYRVGFDEIPPFSPISSVTIHDPSADEQEMLM
jgi:hypothetical protein